MANMMAKATIVTTNHVIISSLLLFWKEGENAMTMAMIRVGMQLMVPHKISVILFGGLYRRVPAIKGERKEAFETNLQP